MEQAEKQKKLEMIDLLRSRISVMKNYQQDMNQASWFGHVGIILTGNEAQIVLECLEKDIDDHIRETGGTPMLSWFIEKVELLISFFKRKK